MRNHSGKRFRGATSLTTEPRPQRSRLFIERKGNRQCGACKHYFTVKNKKAHNCPECGCKNTRVIA